MYVSEKGQLFIKTYQNFTLANKQLQCMHLKYICLWFIAVIHVITIYNHLYLVYFKTRNDWNQCKFWVFKIWNFHSLLGKLRPFLHSQIWPPKLPWKNPWLRWAKNNLQSICHITITNCPFRFAFSHLPRCGQLFATKEHAETTLQVICVQVFLRFSNSSKPN